MHVASLHDHQRFLRLLFGHRPHFCHDGRLWVCLGKSWIGMGNSFMLAYRDWQERCNPRYS